MNFAELRFWELLLGGLVLVLAARTLFLRFFAQRAELFDKVTLLLLGLGLLLAVSPVTFCAFLAVALGTYFGLNWILRLHGEAPRPYLLVLIPLQLLPLFYYKYARFAANDVLRLNIDALRDIIIPVGISFYTFQKVAFVLDTVAFKQPLPRFLDYMNFAGFFPQIVAGPIERRNDLLPQMESFRWRWDAAEIDTGARWLALGFYFKCCLADNFAALFVPATPENAYLVWLNNVMFGLRIYYDFAGYSLIALGVARCLGVRLTLNFVSPYCAGSIGDFWRRWHVTLSQWFRDYVYVPLGGGRVRWWAANILIVFLISGVWHGAGWNFVLWGLLHGLFLIGNRLWPRAVKLPSMFGWSLTMLGVFLAWLCFYELNFDLLVRKLQTLATPAAYSLARLQAAAHAWSSGYGVALLGFFVLASVTLFLEWRSFRRPAGAYCLLTKPAVLVVLIALTMLLSPGETNGFIYFAF